MKQTVRQIKVILIGVLSIFAIILIASEGATPLSPFTFQVKRLQEKIFMKLKADPQSKLQYYTYLLNKRLIELESVANSEDSSYLLHTSLRYSTTAGELTNLITENKLTKNIPDIIRLFQEHKRIISDLDAVYPKDFGEEWKFIQDDANYLEIYSQVLYSEMARI